MAGVPVMGALNNAMPFSLIVWAQARIDSGQAAILVAATPLLTALLAHGASVTSDSRGAGSAGSSSG